MRRESSTTGDTIVLLIAYCVHYSCFLGVLQHCCIFCLLSDYDCALRQRQDGVLMLNLKFLFVTLELVFWEPRLLMRLNKILTI